MVLLIDSLGRRILGGAATGAVLLAVAAPGVSSAATYRGKVRNAGPVSFRVAAGKVQRFQASMNVQCVSAAAARSEIGVYVAAPPAARIRRDGRFSLRLNLPKQQFRDKQGAVLQTLYSVKVAVTGRVAGRTATGTAKVTYSKNWLVPNPVTGLLGIVPAACFTGKAPVAWSARRV